MALYRNRQTGIIVDAIEYVSEGRTIVAFVEWYKSPANLMSADGETFVAYYEKIPFDSRNSSSTSADLSFDRGSNEKVLPREVDIRVDRGDIIRVIGDATIIIRKSDDEQEAS